MKAKIERHDHIAEYQKEGETGRFGNAKEPAGGKMKKRWIHAMAALAAVMSAAVVAAGAAAVAMETSLPQGIAELVAEDFGAYIGAGAATAKSVSVAVAPAADETGEFGSALQSFRADLMLAVAEKEYFRLLPASRFDVLSATTAGGGGAGYLTDEQVRRIAAAAPVGYVAETRIAVDASGRTLLTARLRSASGGVALSREYLLRKAGSLKTEEYASRAGAPDSVEAKPAAAPADSDEEAASQEEPRTSVESSQKPDDSEEESADEDSGDGLDHEMDESMRAAIEEAAAAVEAELEEAEDALPEEEMTEPKAAGAPGPLDAALAKLPVATPGTVEYLSGMRSDLPVLALAAIPLKDDGTPGIAVLTSGALDLYYFSEPGRLSRVWSGKFQKVYPKRGVAGTMKVGTFGGKNLLFVSMNPFDRAFAYEWTGESLERAGRVSGFVADAMRAEAVTVMSDYGAGVTSFNGLKTRLVDTSGASPRTVNFPVSPDYYTICARRWSDTSANLTQLVAAGEDGVIRMYEGPGNEKARTETRYGGAVLCAKADESAPGAAQYIVATTESATEDAVALLRAETGLITEIWRAGPFNGAVVALASWDFDGDGRTEIIGALDTGAGFRLFRVLPPYTKR